MVIFPSFKAKYRAISFPGGHSTFFGMINTFVHTIMYSYYMLAALGPRVQKYLWWKKYLTVLQMVGLLLVVVGVACEVVSVYCC
jgi:phosphatidylglycerophosphate synthase